MVMVTTIESPLLTAGETASYLKVARSTVWRLVEAGQLPAVRLGKVVRVRKSSLDAYIAACEDKKPARMTPAQEQSGAQAAQPET
jgi:excisionase family DNA binding protein